MAGVLENIANRLGYRSVLQYDRAKRERSSYEPQRLRGIPSTESGWQERYNWLWDWYTSCPYKREDVKHLRLFRATDLDGETIAMAERLSRDAQFVVDTDVHALAGGRWSLDPRRGTDADTIAAGEAVWRRSDLQSQRAAWLRAVCSMGDLWLEAVRTPRGTRIVAYDPRHCEPTYSADGLDVVSLSVRIPYFDDDVMRVYERTITAEGITAAELDPDSSTMRREIAGETGAHGLGVAPVVHLRCQPIVGIPEHSLWSGHGLDRYTAAVDSIMAQTRAIAQRYAHPHMVIKGFRLGDTAGEGSGLESFGKLFNGVPADGEIEYLEAGMGAIQPIGEMLREYIKDVRATIPEFTLAGSGANTTGRALEFRADQFRRKINDLATRTHDPIALVTQYAVELDREQEHDPDSRVFRIGSPPPLPVDKPQHLSMVIQAHGAGLIRRTDAVRHMQALGMVDEEIDAEEYAADLQPAPSVDTPTNEG